MEMLYIFLSNKQSTAKKYPINKIRDTSVAATEGKKCILIFGFKNQNRYKQDLHNIGWEAPLTPPRLEKTKVNSPILYPPELRAMRKSCYLQILGNTCEELVNENDNDPK
ncbi:MAG: hypothetical protein LDL41_24470 [Coleofasciculus sp. S288]|nr:hypothetical protein [Coleofasciculus sp. S288]